MPELQRVEVLNDAELHLASLNLMHRALHHLALVQHTIHTVQCIVQYFSVHCSYTVQTPLCLKYQRAVLLPHRKVLSYSAARAHSGAEQK